MKRLSLIFLTLFLLPFCSTSITPKKRREIGVIILRDKKAEFSGRNFLIKVGKKRLRITGKVTFTSILPGESYYSIQIGSFSSPDEKKKGIGEFFLKVEKNYLLLHGKYSTRGNALKEIKRIGKGFPIKLWEKGESAIRLSEGKNIHYGERFYIYPGPDIIKIDGKPYRGHFVVTQGARGIKVTEFVGIEDFIKGCYKNLPAFSSPFEALKANAVVLRTLALNKYLNGNLEGKDFKYKGIEGENPLFSRAVEQTKGEVVIYEGKLAYTPFTLSCGGITETGGLPYLPSRKCWDRKWKTIEGVNNHYDPSLNVIEALGIFDIDDEDREVDKATAQKWLWNFSSYISAKKFLPIEEDGKIGFLRALGKTIMEIKPSDTVEPLEYLIDLGIVNEDEIREKELTEGDAASFLYSALDVLGKIKWEKGKVHISNNTILLKNEKVRDVETFRNGKEGLVSAEKIMIIDGETLKFIRDKNGKISAIAENGYSGNGEERIWRKKYSSDSLRKRIQSYLPIEELQDLRVSERTSTGRVSKLSIMEDDHSYSLEGKEIMEALSLPSTWFIIDREYDEDGNISGFFFCGRGEGNGVGMCQLGAIRKAKKGKNYREILSFFYPGTEIRRNYGGISKGKK